MNVIASLVILHLINVILMAVLPIPSQQDSMFFFVVMIIIEAVVSVTITKMIMGKENTMLAITIYIFGMWLFGTPTGFLAIVIALVMWVVSMLVAAA